MSLFHRFHARISMKFLSDLEVTKNTQVKCFTKITEQSDRHLCKNHIQIYISVTINYEILIQEQNWTYENTKFKSGVCSFLENFNFSRKLQIFNWFASGFVKMRSNKIQEIDQLLLQLFFSFHLNYVTVWKLKYTCELWFLSTYISLMHHS